MLVEDWVPPSIPNLLIQELSGKCETASFVSDTLPQISADTLLDDPEFWGIVLWGSGGYNFTLAGSTSINPCIFGEQLMLHIYSGSYDLSWSKASAVVAILNAPTEERRGVRILSGPYDNPNPAHPYFKRVSLQLEATVYNNYKAVAI